MRLKLSRRRLMLGAGAAAALTAGPARAETGPLIHVMKDPTCGCCSAWIEILERAGFVVTTENSGGTALMRYKFRYGIPQDMVACHTGRIADYMIEGHVPPADIRRLLDESPDAVGLAVPGMPWGSPGMGPESERQAYDVNLILRDGSTRVFTHYDAA